MVLCRVADSRLERVINTMLPRSPLTLPHSLLLLVIIAGSAALFFSPKPQPFISNWNASPLTNHQVTSDAPVQRGFFGIAQAQAQEAANQPLPIGEHALEAYNQGSALQEDAGEGRVRFFRRDVAGGSLAYIVVKLDERVHIEVVNADGATPTSDASGDTLWSDGQRHLATVKEMVDAPYAGRDGLTLLGAMAFGFHGAERTSNEGSVVINGQVLRSNPGRATLCITKDGTAHIGKLSAEELQNCHQAIGGGPVVLWNGKIANPDVSSETDEFVPFNPLSEDFVQLDWRKKIYTGGYPKTVVGIGSRADGASYLVMAISTNMHGVELARQLRDMGCFTALGGDDDTSTQAVWRGEPVYHHQVREVPDAIAVYLRP